MTMQFSKPVCVLVGLGYRREIRSVLEAFECLNDCPGDTREKAAALAACRAALEGRTRSDTARLALISFALKQDQLITNGGAPDLAYSAGAHIGGTTSRRS